MKGMGIIRSGERRSLGAQIGTVAWGAEMLTSTTRGGTNPNKMRSRVRGQPNCSRIVLLITIPFPLAVRGARSKFVSRNAFPEKLARPHFAKRYHNSVDRL